MLKRVFVLSLIGIVLVSFLALTQEKVLHWNLGTDPATIDPSYATGVASQQIDHALFLGLTDIDDNTLAIIPRLATAWEASEDGLSWTFHLRTDAMWNDGTPVTAHDITFAIERTLDPSGSSPLAQKLYVLKGAEAYNTGNGRARDIGMRAIDNHTVRFTLSEPNDCFPVIVSDPVFCPQPRSIVEDYGIDWTKPEHMVTDGPYTLGQWVRDDRIILYKSVTYYDAAHVNIGQIYCHMIADESTALAMYKEGKLDVVSVGQEDAERIKADPSLSSDLHISPSQPPLIGPGYLSTLANTPAQLTKPYVVRTYALLGREKWENWENWDIMPPSPQT